LRKSTDYQVKNKFDCMFREWRGFKKIKPASQTGIRSWFPAK